MKQYRVCVAVLAMALVVFGALPSHAQTQLRESITGHGLLQVIQEGDDIFRVDQNAKGVQFKRESDWNIFFDEANRAHARLAASSDETVEADAYNYLVAFYRALTNEEFRQAFLAEHANMASFVAEEALQVALETAKEGLIRLDDDEPLLDLLIEWYETLNQARNLAAEGIISSDTVENEKNVFTAAVHNVAVDLADNAPTGKVVSFGKHLRALGLNYGLSRKVRVTEDSQKAKAFNEELHEALVNYAMGLVDRNDVSLQERLDVMADAAVALLELRKIRGLEENRIREEVLVTAVNQLESQIDDGDVLNRLEKDLRVVFVKQNIAPELWLGTELPSVPKQEEPKPYKIALQNYRDLYSEAMSLLESGSLSVLDAARAELVALEAQSWASQLIQDKGIVFSDDFDFEQAEVEKDKLLEIRQQVENNPNQKSQKAIDLVNKARLHEIEFYQYQYTPESLQQAIDLVTVYTPEVLPSLDDPIPSPEGYFAVHCGVGMLVWKAEAFDRLERFDEAEALFTHIVELYGDRYRYPDPWCFSFVRFANQHLVNIPNKRAELANAIEGGTE